MDEAAELYEEHGAWIHGRGGEVKYALLRCDVCGARFKYGSASLLPMACNAIAQYMGLVTPLQSASRRSPTIETSFSSPIAPK